MTHLFVAGVLLRQPASGRWVATAGDLRGHFGTTDLDPKRALQRLGRQAIWYATNPMMAVLGQDMPNALP